MNVLDLPEGVVHHILCMLNTRSLLCAASTCTALRKLVDAVPLRPVMTSQTRMLPWLMQPHVCPRVTSLVSRCSMWGRCAFLEALHNLRSLVVTFGKVRAPMLRFLPTSLEHLDLHRLACDGGDVFVSSKLRRLTRLRTLKMTFTPDWDIVVLDGLETLPLEHLSIRLAPALVLRAPLRIRKVRLHALLALICPFEIYAEDLAMECTRGAVAYDVIVTRESSAGLRHLTLSSPHRITVPSLEHMHALETLHLRYDSALLSLHQLAGLRHLRALTVDTRFGVAVTGMRAVLPAHVAILVLVGGVPLPQPTVASIFRGARPTSTPIPQGTPATA